MASFISTELYQFTAYINHAENGWSESFYLRDQTRAGALATAAELLEARSWILGANCVIEWAEIKFLQEQPNTQAAIGDPVGPLAMWAPPDNDTIGLFFRYQTGTGKYAKHIFRGIADDEITDNKWTRAPLTLPAGIFPRPANPNLATKDDLFRYWLTLTREKTCHAEFLVNLAPFGNIWKLTPWTYIVYRHPSTLAYSSSFQRISGEWGDWNQSADFSYCGTVFGVERACRDTDAYAYIDGPKIVFRTYFAAPAATVFPHPTIFHGVCRFKQITNTGPPGELTGAKKTLANPSGVWEYNPGLAAGAAPGVMWTGLPSRFLGRDPIPFNPFPDTPMGYRPGCDMPVVNAVRVRETDASIDVADVFIINIDSETLEETQDDLHEITLKAVQPEAPEWPPAAEQVPYRVDRYASSLTPAYVRVGDELHGNINASLGQIDGGFLALNGLIILSDGTANAGVWKFTQEGNGSQPYIFERVEDFDEQDDFADGILFYVRNGTANGARLFTMSILSPWTFDTDPVFFGRHTRYTAAFSGLCTIAFINANGDIGQIAATQASTGEFTVNGPLIANEGITIDDAGAIPFSGTLLVRAQNPTFTSSAAVDLASDGDVALHGAGGGTTSFGASMFLGVGAATIYSSEGLGMVATIRGYVWMTRGLAMWNGFYYEEGGTGAIGPGARALNGVITYPGSGPFLTGAMVTAMIAAAS